MKQSKDQHKKVAVELPDYVTLKQYSDVMNITKDDTIYYKMVIISLTTGKTFDEVKNLPIQILPKLYNDCVMLYSEESLPIKAIEMKGKKLALSLAYKKTIGEFSDLETMIKSGDVFKIASTMFQSYKVKDDYKWQDKGDYKCSYVDGDFVDNLEEYDFKNNLEHSFFEDFPLSAYRATVGFTAGIGASFSLVSQSSSAGKKNNQIHKTLAEGANGISDGLGSYVILRKLTSFASRSSNQ